MGVSEPGIRGSGVTLGLREGPSRLGPLVPAGAPPACEKVRRSEAQLSTRP